MSPCIWILRKTTSLLTSWNVCNKFKQLKIKQRSKNDYENKRFVSYETLLINNFSELPRNQLFNAATRIQCMFRSYMARMVRRQLVFQLVVFSVDALITASCIEAQARLDSVIFLQCVWRKRFKRVVCAVVSIQRCFQNYMVHCKMLLLQRYMRQTGKKYPPLSFLPLSSISKSVCM